MTPKILEQLERASNAEDDEALAIFRHLSESLDNLGMSWTSLARTKQSVLDAGEDSRPAVDDAMSKRIASLTATEDLGAYLRTAHNAISDIDKVLADQCGDERWLTAHGIKRAEEDWLKYGFADWRMLDSLFNTLLSFEIDPSNLNACMGFAQERWIENHKAFLEERRAQREAEELELFSEVRELCHRKSEIAGGLKREILNYAREHPDLIELWGEALCLKRPQSTKLDFDGLDNALNGGNNKAARIAIVFLADIAPAELWIYAPVMSDIRDGSYRDRIKQHELDKEVGAFTKAHRQEFESRPSVIAFRDHVRTYMDRCLLS